MTERAKGAAPNENLVDLLVTELAPALRDAIDKAGNAYGQERYKGAESVIAALSIVLSAYCVQNFPPDAAKAVARSLAFNLLPCVAQRLEARDLGKDDNGHPLRIRIFPAEDTSISVDQCATPTEIAGAMGDCDWRVADRLCTALCCALVSAAEKEDRGLHETELLEGIGTFAGIAINRAVSLEGQAHFIERLSGSVRRAIDRAPARKDRARAIHADLIKTFGHEPNSPEELQAWCSELYERREGIDCN